MDLHRSQNEARLQRFALGLLLAVTLAVFQNAPNADFYIVDDLVNVADNEAVQAGLTWDSIHWSFTTTHGSNWMPLAWLSYLVDAEFFGRTPAAYHAQNLLWHLAATTALFLALRRLTRAPWTSLFVTALFAIHPLHVESVLWINERKDLMSGFFFAVALWSYAGYVRAPSRARYAAIALAMALGLLAKPMLVTLPCVLLLLDVWPLRRSESWMARTIEKLPLFGLSVLSSLTTLWAQQPAMPDLATFPLDARLWNALQSYVTYVQRMLWPVDLAVHYPHPRAGASMLWGLAAGALLAGVSGLALRLRTRHPYFLVGWLWYLGMLVPVIGIVQVGSQASADRYTYLPLIGLFLAIAFGVSRAFASLRVPRRLPAGLAIVAIGILAARAHHQVDYWRDSETLLRRALAVTHDNYVVEYNLGWVLAVQGRSDEALPHFTEALRIEPDSTDARLNLAAMLGSENRVDEAIAQLEALLASQPDHPRARLMLAIAQRQRATAETAGADS